MSKVVYSKHIYNCEASSIDVYFEYNNSVVYSTEMETSIWKGIQGKKCKEVILISKCEIEEYESVMELNKYARKDALVVQGIISFFTGFPLTVYHSDSSTVNVGPIQYKKQEIHLIIEGVDYTEDLIKLLDRLNEEPELIITLLDRWRKGIFLKAESLDADLYYDEAILSFFHILELFADTINKELRKNLEDNIENMLYQHFKSYYYTDNQIKQMTEENKKAVNSLLIGDFLNLSIKVKYFLEKYALLDDNLAFFIDNMIKIRNAIAHGRITYQKDFMWPLSPFFNLAKDSYESIDFLYFLTAVMISRYIGINCWENEWIEAKDFLMPPAHILESFLEGKLQIENFKTEMLVKGNERNITWQAIFNFYVKNPKKAKREKLERGLKEAFLETIIDEENGPDLFNISIIFADSEDEEIMKKATENIKTIISNRWYVWSNFKDAFTYLKFYSVKVIWYKKFLDNGEYLECKNS